MDETLRILFVEDSPSDQELAEFQLRADGIELTPLRVDTQPAFLQALTDFKPHLIISDYAMPEFEGMLALKLLQELHEDIPFIVLTGSINEDTAVGCLKSGADDYVIKDHIHHLPFAVREVLKHHQERKDKVLVDQQLRESEAKFRALFQNNHAVILLVDPTAGLIVDANPAASKYYGWSIAELTGMPMTEINNMSPEDINKEMRAAEREARSCNKFQHRRKGGDIRDVEIFCSPINHQGKTLVYAIVHDITTRQQAEDKLKQKVDELIRYQNLTVGRELKMIELKKEVNALLKQLGREAKYEIVSIKEFRT